MIKRITISLLYIAVLMGWVSCKKVYQPKIVTGDNKYLVVEAMINTGPDPTRIHLSRTVPLTSNAGATPETGAVVTIISDANVTYPVFEQGNGDYQSVPINAGGPGKYSVKISTADGKSYQSDFVEAKPSPPIDSIYYKVKADGIDIYADTHDPSGNSRYYQWSYEDTYVFASAFNSAVYYSPTPKDTILPRPLANQIYQCWRSDASSALLLNTSAKLTNDVISGNLLLSIPSTSEKIARRYSIKVNQFVLTKDAYNYYQQLKKNSEQLGGIFDPQPSELPGNVHCLTNPSETVIGYVIAGTPTSSRIFIDNHSLPNWQEDSPYLGCKLDTDLYARVLGPNHIVDEVAERIYTGTDIPVVPVAPPMSPPIGYSVSSPFCVDCTLRGTNVRPDFWTDL